ncbi:MAG TPA: pyridoxamine 5'-phosphate oxidase family protein [Chloroflexota bacterium]|nr:pyridoxamine 5'-phosphate oxidase family protein [Chloroflexota bacterium]
MAVTAGSGMRDLASAEIEQLLTRRKVGRIGLYDQQRRRVYVVPVSYYFNDGAAYLHTAPGLKLNLLHEQPADVCFQADDIADEGEWQSVIGWGHFQEITDVAERQRVLRGFGDRLLRGPLRHRQHVGRGGMLGGGETVYRIVFDELTGRADSSGWTAGESD